MNVDPIPTMQLCTSHYHIITLNGTYLVGARTVKASAGAGSRRGLGSLWKITRRGRTGVVAGEEIVGFVGSSPSPVNALVSLFQVQVALPVLAPGLLGVVDSRTRQMLGRFRIYRCGA